MPSAPRRFPPVSLVFQKESPKREGIRTLPGTILIGNPGAYLIPRIFSLRRFNLPQPIYINIVRDPVERVISWYYYVRAPWYYVERKQIFPDLPLPDPNWLKKDFESCVLKADRECRYLEGEIHEGIGDHRRQTLFFCGHSERCTYVLLTRDFLYTYLHCRSSYLSPS